MSRAQADLAHHAILVTNNVREFGRVEGLKPENWIEAVRDRSPGQSWSG